MAINLIVSIKFPYDVCIHGSCLLQIFDYINEEGAQRVRNFFLSGLVQLSTVP